MLTFILKVYPFFAWLGSLVIFTGILVAALGYRGKAGERYTIRNHFISELGERGVSKYAAAFNIAMIIGGVLFLPMMVGLGLNLDSVWGKLGMIAGITAALGCTFVGIFPLDNLTPHRIAAMTYFRAGLVTAFFFTIAVFVQPAETRVVPLFVNIFGILALTSYAVFLFIVSRKMDMHNTPNYILDPAAMPDRPIYWRTAFWEWMVLFSTILWFLIIVLQI